MSNIIIIFNLDKSNNDIFDELNNNNSLLLYFIISSLNNSNLNE